MRFGVRRLSSLVVRPQRALPHSKPLTTFAKHTLSSRLTSRALNSLELHQRRHFSTSPNEQNSPPEGLQEVLATFSKVQARQDLFHEYEKKDLFAPSSMSWLANRLMFYHLNRPQETILDLVEFIQGAKYAMEAAMKAMYSREFADYVAREAEAPGALEPDCETAQMVQRSLETISYEAFKEFVLQSAKDGIQAELEKIELHSAHLLSVQYERVAKRPTKNSLGATVVGVPVDERLKLAVLFSITEHVSLDGEEEVIVRENNAIWQFESKVTTPEDIDWVIEPLHLVA
ncbi:hypothetical protein P3T76_005856 [Phytophthora citrophthora]|uniref:Uncharacterized protein n=1 Tax=Phytophthora citrophthora TaxID=4793 RepID=A0AAD9GPN5_9STRA|nr:hypothetical protein P3T76_005856 [Phytophthora citrophthora]